LAIETIWLQKSCGAPARTNATFHRIARYLFMTQKNADDPIKSKSHSDDGATEIEGQKARGGEIILNKPWRRIVFFGGLIAMVLFIIVATIMGYS